MRAKCGVAFAFLEGTPLRNNPPRDNIALHCMANRTLYLPDELLERLDARIAEGPDFNHGRGSFAGVVKLAIERYLGDQPATVKDVFREAVGPGVSRADSFRRATQR